MGRASSTISIVLAEVLRGLFLDFVDFAAVRNEQPRYWAAISARSRRMPAIGGDLSSVQQRSGFTGLGCSTSGSLFVLENVLCMLTSIYVVEEGTPRQVQRELMSLLQILHV